MSIFQSPVKVLKMEELPEQTQVFRTQKTELLEKSLRDQSLTAQKGVMAEMILLNNMTLMRDGDPLEDPKDKKFLSKQYEYQYARLALDKSLKLNPSFNDYTHFREIVESKMPEIVGVFRVKEFSIFHNKSKDSHFFEKRNYKGLSLIQKIMSPSKEKPELSVYLHDLMKERKIVGY